MAHLLEPQPRTPLKWPPLARRYLQRSVTALERLRGQDAPDPA
jgi:hypothetical protein